MEEDWTLDNLHAQIFALVRPAVARMVAFTGQDSLYRDSESASRKNARAMLGSLPEASERAVRRVMSLAFGEAPPADFWYTDLGQAFYAAGGWADGFVRKVEAANILRVSHQSVTYSIKSGELAASDDRVQASSVRAKWLRRGGSAHPLALERKVL